MWDYLHFSPKVYAFWVKQSADVRLCFLTQLQALLLKLFRSGVRCLNQEIKFTLGSSGFMFPKSAIMAMYCVYVRLKGPSSGVPPL